MSLSNFIPNVWAAQLLDNLHKAHVYANPLVINRDYEGDISAFGDTVRINSIGAVTVRDYARDTDIVSPDKLESAQTIMAIDQAKYFNFAVDDLDKAQTKPKVMGGAMEEAGYAVADVNDQFLAALATNNVATANLLGSSASPKTDLATAGVPYGYLVTLNQKLTEANVPLQNRWAIVPPWFYTYIQKDPTFLHSTNLGDLMLRMGILNAGETPSDVAMFVGMIGGMAIFMSNNVINSSGTSYQILAGHKIAWSYAEQIVEIEAYRPEKRFGDAVKGLHVYGGKVTRPNALAMLFANPT